MPSAVVRGRRQRPQCVVGQRPDRAKGVIGRHALFRREVAEHVAGLLVVSAHYVAPFRSAGSMVVRRDRSGDPASPSFQQPARWDGIFEVMHDPHFMACLRKSGPRPGSPDTLPSRRCLQKEIPVIFLAETDGVLVGSCALAVIPGLTRGARPFGVIENVVTHAAHRRQGIGTTLLQHAVSCAWERRCYKVMLLTGSKRPEMLRFYDSAGFQAGVKTGFVMWNPNVQIPLRSPTR